jgi:hypothetical protein
LSTILHFSLLFHETETILDSVEEETEEAIAEVHLDQPHKERKSKKADKDRAKKAVSGKDSMAPPNKHFRDDFADVTPQENIPGPNASSPATYLGENRHPIPVINDHRKYGTTVWMSMKIHGNPLGTLSLAEGSLHIMRADVSKTTLRSLS